MTFCRFLNTFILYLRGGKNLNAALNVMQILAVIVFND